MNKNDRKRHRSTRGLVDPNRTKTYIVSEETQLLPFLCTKITSQSQHNVRRIIANHQVAVGGAPVSLFAYKLFPEDEVTVSWNRIQKHERHDLPIIYEDDDIIAINKPSGLLSTPSDREKGHTAYRLVSDYVTQKDRNARIFVVHRLDEDTSGVLIFAKSFEVREALQNNWQEIVTNRGYYAIVEGMDIPEEGVLKDYLAQDSTFTVFVCRNPSHGKLAITKYQKIASKNGYSLLDVHLETGRKNQIRVQLGNIGHYVIGDDRYGEPSDPLHRLGLHAYELDFKNPLNNKEYKLNAPMPPEFKKMFFKTHEQIKALDEAKERPSGEHHHSSEEKERHFPAGEERHFDSKERHYQGKERRFDGDSRPYKSKEKRGGYGRKH
jgi:23S rRNA pseudouridine1911/1915/1917 synthase